MSDALSKILGFYKKVVKTAITEHKTSASTVFQKERRYDELKKRKSLVRLVCALGKFSVIVTEDREFDSALLTGKIHQLIMLLEDAPDVHSSRSAIAELLGGANNIPGGIFTWEDTLPALDSFMSHMEGLESFMKMVQKP